MDGGYAPRVAAPRVRRGTRMLAFVASSLLGVAASRALADDPAALRPLAKRYADPRQLFDTEENDMQFKQVVDTQKTFRVPPRPAPTIRFAMEEPPAFVMGLGQSRYRFDSAAPAPAAKTSTRPQTDQRPIAVTAKPQSESQPVSAPTASQNYQRPFPLSSQQSKSLVVVRVPQPPPAQPTESVANSQQVPPEPEDIAQTQPTQTRVAAAADAPPQNYQRPFPLSAQQPKSLVVVRVPQQPPAQSAEVAANPQQVPPELQDAPQMQPAQTPVAAAADAPPQNFQRPFPLSAQQPKSLVVVRVPQQPPAQSAEVAASPQPVPLQLDAASQSQPRQASVVTADTQVAQPAVSAPVSPRESAGRVVVASSQDSTTPPVRFAEAEPPAFALPRMPQSMPASAYAPVQMPPHYAAPIPIVANPAESPSLTIPAPPTADMVPDAPAFSSTGDPLNITISAVTDQPPPPAPGVDASAAAAQSGAPGSFGEVEKLGDAPPANTLSFLRQDAVLLKPGEHQFDWGFAYSVYNYNAALPVVNSSGTVVGVTNERIRLQLMTIPFAFRYGICDGLQGYVNAPLGWSNDETTNDQGGSLTNNFVSMGDISAGLNYQIMKGCGAYVPDVIASVGFIAPTGHATFATSLLAPNSALGQGFWDITCSILAVHTIDPVVFYYGGGYVHRFDATFGNNLEVDPGQEFDYVFGCGFAVNPYVTISGTFIGNYITRYGVNDVSLPGTDLDLMRFRVSVTMVKDKHICEPWGEIGMTPDTPSRVGITFTY
jgi:hypothetical protein